MKVLVVAHPDDEILWFAAEKYDRIIIVHLERGDYAGFGVRRLEAMKHHPLAERITCLGFPESDYWRDKSKAEEHERNYRRLCQFLETLDAEEVDTHDLRGEYGHADHVMVHNACMDTLNCLVNGKNAGLYRAARKAYKDAGCWTWD